MKRVPILPTLFVALCVAVMIKLAFWQLDRRAEKEALLAHYAVAAKLPPMAFPAIPVGEQFLFRKASGFCLEPVFADVEAGRNRDGGSGWRHIVQCRTGAEGPGLVVDIGWSRDFAVKPAWKGGTVTGMISAQPAHRSLISRAMGKDAATALMLITDAPAPGLEPSAVPSPVDIPNNHLSYAVQWFAFAGLAALIYGIALTRRMRR